MKSSRPIDLRFFLLTFTTLAMLGTGCSKPSFVATNSTEENKKNDDSIPTPTPSPVPEPTATPHPFPTPTPVPGDNPDATPTPTPTATPVPPTATPTPTPTPVPTPSPTPQPTATPSPTPRPTATPTPTPAPSPTPRPTATPLPTPSPTPVPQPVSEVFKQNRGANQVDILVISDNSSSMLPDQRKLGAKFGDFTAALPGIDWHIGVTTTDVTKDGALKGSLSEYMKTGEFILTPKTPDALKLFLNTVVRPESIECEKKTSKCGSGSEQPLAATIWAMSKANAENKGFFRDDVDFAVLVISDEDEMSDGKNKKTTTAQMVTEYFTKMWGSTKKFAGYGIVIQPDDKTCLTAQRKESGSTGYYGTKVSELAKATNGSTMSICEVDYGPALKRIAENIRKSINSFELAKIPVPGTVEVILTPNEKVAYKIEGRLLIFDRAPAPGTRIDVRYIPAN